MSAGRSLAAGLLVLLACAAVRAQEAEMHGSEALRGFEAVRLRLELEPAGVLPRETVLEMEKGAAERLRAAGLSVVPGGGGAEAQAAPVLFYRVTLVPTNCGYVGTADVQLRESVRVSRAPGAETTAATWQHVARIHFSPPDPPRFGEKLLSLLDLFVKEYKAANGR